MEHLIKAVPKSMTLFQAILERRSKLKQLIMENNSSLVSQGSPSIYQIHTQYTFISGDIRKYQLGTDEHGSTDKVIMMVGATGSGKSTMINAMFNHVVGVKWKDSFRFRLVDEPVKGTQADSQTDTITAYTIHHQDGFAVPYTLTIIDTPGFGDTRGKEPDKKLKEQIKLFFTTAGDAGIDHIDAVGFVVKASDARLTENQKYIFNSVLSIWGNNLKGNIFMFFPFAGRKTPAALAAIKLAKIPYDENMCFKFDNSALFDKNDDGDILSPAYWNLSAENFDQFLNKHLITTDPKSLTLSKTVLQVRDVLLICQNGNKEDIKNIGTKQEQLNAQIEKLKKHEAVLEEIENSTDQERCLDFTYAEIEENLTMVLVDHKRAVNCSNCRRTCHYPCMAILTVYTCSMFRWGGDCKVCFCSVMEHDIEDFKYERERKTITKTNEDLRRQYLHMQEEERTDTEEIIIKLEKKQEVIRKKLEAAQKKAFGLVMVSRLLLKTLQEIALLPAEEMAEWKERDYIEQMIQTEEKEEKVGWIERTQQLQELQSKSEKLLHEWNTVLDQINPDYSADPKLSTEDNEMCRKWQKIVLFKKIVQKQEN